MTTIPADDPSTKFNSAVVDVTPSNLLISAVVAVTPSIILSSAAEAVTNVEPNLSPLFPLSCDDITKSLEPSEIVTSPFTVNPVNVPTLVIFACAAVCNVPVTFPDKLPLKTLAVKVLVDGLYFNPV